MPTEYILTWSKTMPAITAISIITSTMTPTTITTTTAMPVTTNDTT